LVGVVPDPDVEDATAHLEGGDSLVFYTDGVTEARGAAGMMGEGGLRELLSSCAGMDADAIASAIENAAVEMQEGETRDDIAVVVLQAAENVVRAATNG
jgi:sigma-B regulation protein RsbU (phosphoserine phosphatase)